MDELLAGLMSKVGLSEEQAHKVIEFLKENADQIPQWLAATGLDDKIRDVIPDSVEDQLEGALGGLFGGGD